MSGMRRQLHKLRVECRRALTQLDMPTLPTTAIIESNDRRFVSHTHRTSLDIVCVCECGARYARLGPAHLEACEFFVANFTHRCCLYGFYSAMRCRINGITDSRCHFTLFSILFVVLRSAQLVIFSAYAVSSAHTNRIKHTYRRTPSTPSLNHADKRRT